MIRIELMPIGREILTGRIQEKNAAWIARRIAEMGGFVSRITVLDDDKMAISAEVDAAKKRSAEILIATGGLGPTFDDITVEALSAGLGIETDINPSALEFVAGKYRSYFAKGQVPHAEITPEREKMAILPIGASWFENPVGAAPAMRIESGGMILFALPGPPRELQPIYERFVEPELRKILGKSAFAEQRIQTAFTDESVITEICRGISAKFPGIHAKSNPTFFGDNDGLSVTISAWASNDELCRSLLSNAIDELNKRLKDKAL